MAAENYATAKEFLSALTAPLARDSRDRGFSYLTTVAEDEARSATGAYAGFGFRFARAGDGRYRISDVYENGPAFTGGFLRGAELLAVDRGEGFTTLVDYAARGVSLGDIFGPPRAGVERGFRRRIEGAGRRRRLRGCPSVNGSSDRPLAAEFRKPLDHRAGSRPIPAKASMDQAPTLL